MRHISLMCAGLALCMLMNSDGGSGGGAAGLTTVDDGADEPSSGGGSEATVNVEHADNVDAGSGEVAQDSDDGDATPADGNADKPAGEGEGD